MRIATWNIERLKHKQDIDEILRLCNAQRTDILVLTETDEQVRPKFRYSFQTPRLADAPAGYALPAAYGPTENRVSIFTDYPCVKQHETFDKYTALCIELETELGNLLVYGTIIGILGNRHPSFQADLISQTADFKRFSCGNNLCVCGDFNCSFSDNYYFTEFGRKMLTGAFETNKMSLLTACQQDCIDHIAISKGFLPTNEVDIWEWNLEKTLSDHKGIAISLG